MARLNFHWSNARGALIDPFRADMSDLVEARDHAEQVVQSLIASSSLQDRRNWVLHVSDQVGDEIFVLPFAFGRPH
jgi:hypothetical protein